ncbi:PUA-like domain-containing protein [Amylocystis lapponica]|nr:PUA-like domain-containing protein [Amylocystis lapponica]
MANKYATSSSSATGIVSDGATSTYPEDENHKGTYGPIEGVNVGDVWCSRKELVEIGLHLARTAGISGNQTYGAYSIVMSGGYTTDQDKGETIYYTGAGGKKEGDVAQTNHQSFEHMHNNWLMKSIESRRPVRLIRGSKLDSDYAPGPRSASKVIYRYDGLYYVTKSRYTKDLNGNRVCQFRLRRRHDQLPIPEKWDWMVKRSDLYYN